MGYHIHCSSARISFSGFKSLSFAFAWWPGLFLIEKLCISFSYFLLKSAIFIMISGSCACQHCQHWVSSSRISRDILEAALLFAPIGGRRSDTGKS